MQLDPQLAAQKKKMQMEIIFKDSDVKKLMRAKLQTEVEIRELKKKQSQLQMEIMEKEKKLKKMDAENLMFQNELIKLKHKINNLGRE